MSDRDISATAWTPEDAAPVLEGDDVTVRAELSDVDEVALLVHLPAEGDDEPEVVCVHLHRVHAIALAGQLASAATQSHLSLPTGHVMG